MLRKVFAEVYPVPTESIDFIFNHDIAPLLVPLKPVSLPLAYVECVLAYYGNTICKISPEEIEQGKKPVPFFNYFQAITPQHETYKNRLIIFSCLSSQHISADVLSLIMLSLTYVPQMSPDLPHRFPEEKLAEIGRALITNTLNASPFKK